MCFIVFLAITSFELAMIVNPRVQLETNKFVVLLKFVVAFLHVCVKIEAQYEGYKSILIHTDEILSCIFKIKILSSRTKPR